jgi:hypothetical protein
MWKTVASTTPPVAIPDRWSYAASLPPGTTERIFEPHKVLAGERSAAKPLAEDQADYQRPTAAASCYR